MSPLLPSAGGGLRLFSIFGIEIRLDFSVAIIFGLVVYSLGSGLFPQWHPDWPQSTAWLTALVAGVLFFASLLAHELSHSLTARRYGIRVPRITLFLFGGVAEIESEAQTPSAELTIAIAGPLMSAFLGAVFTVIAFSSMDPSVRDAFADDPEAVIAGLSPGYTACLWLGSVNMMLAVFNLIPGFPLDGGRVFRAIVWKLTGNQLRATRLATTTGRWFGWTIMGIGLWNLLVLKSGGGLWLLLIGWFLSHLAAISYSQALTQHTLASLRVRDVMRTRFEFAPAGITLDKFINEYLLRSNQILWPLQSPAGVVGAVNFEQVANVPPDQRASRLVQDVMVPVERLPALDADALATDALTTLLGAGDQPVPVVSGQRIVGLVRGSDILKWVMLHQSGARR